MGVHHLHEEKKVLHRDIKPNNVFLMDHKRVIQLGDFGLAKVINDPDKQVKAEVSKRNPSNEYSVSLPQTFIFPILEPRNTNARTHTLSLFRVPPTSWQLSSTFLPWLSFCGSVGRHALLYLSRDVQQPTVRLPFGRVEPRHRPLRASCPGRAVSVKGRCRARVPGKHEQRPGEQMYYMSNGFCLL